MIIRIITVMVIMINMTTSAHINTVGTGELCIFKQVYTEVEITKVNRIRKNQRLLYKILHILECINL